MRIARLKIENFRGIKQANLLFPKHAVLIGDNNTGKTTILEALDLVLGPDRLNRQSAIDEHDFFRGIYTQQPNASLENTDIEVTSTSQQVSEVTESSIPKILIEATIADLTDEQKGKFGDYIEFWDSATDKFYDEPDPNGVDAASITEAIRVTFLGWYDKEEDDFEGQTYFARSLTESDKPDLFSRKHKQLCGFLLLRSVRTGSRALSLERGSLLDIILRLKEVRPQMWESTLATISEFVVASDPELGISPILETINTSLKKYVPKEWGAEPHLKISNLTRDHLRKVITAFIATGDGLHVAPFYRQGTGTINMLVLAMLSQIAENKQNVIFAMEEPETAIPPYAQKRIIHEVRKLASQALFTSHSPYVLEEFETDETVVLARDADGLLVQNAIVLPDNVKLKRYRQEFRTRFCEGLLARRVLIAEGPTEYSAFPVACRRLAELNSEKYSSLEALGICTVDAGGETNVPGTAKLYKSLGKLTFAICDYQEDDNNKALIDAEVELNLMHEHKGSENLVLNGTTDEALSRFSNLLGWPDSLEDKYSKFKEKPYKDFLEKYFTDTKGIGGLADFLAQCREEEIPQWLRDAALKLKAACTPEIISVGVAAEPAHVEATPEAGADGTD